jgi:hypothetical protein
MIASLFFGALLLADPVQLDCPVAEMTASERTAMEQFVAEQGPTGDPRMQSVYRAVLVCAGRYGWPREVVGQAAGYVFTVIAAETARQRLAARGIDVAGLERRLLADPALRDIPEGAEPLRTAVNGFFRRNREYVTSLAGRPSRQAEQALTMLGIFMGARVSMEISRARFAEQ